MINHYRTILLNESGSVNQDMTYPGEEYVDPSFTKKKITSKLDTVRKLLLGQSPDRAFINYRLKQITTMWHDSILRDEVINEDNRITYWPLDTSINSNINMFGTITIEGMDPVVKTKLIPSVQPISSGSGRSLWLLSAQVDSGVCVVTDEKTKEVKSIPAKGVFFDFGNNIVLNLPNGSYRITAIGVPHEDIGQALVDCDLIKDTDIEFELFLGNDSLKEIWRRSEDISERLGSLALALAKKMYELKS